ncbi:DUF4492 domain-containing protein [Arcobacter peruensis]|uniref:DUF4492 domain-containing protein n=1 Tax=Arcobacter peruensis TaxID=2320140 RepID=UPI000F0910B5|nr:DUF4492 domain-containing protein [Arcobacter peruensis]
MLNIKNIYSFYVNGFKNMTIGKTLWKLILIKLLVIFLFLNYFVHDKSLKSEYKTYDEKVDFVYKNLTKEN